MVYEMKDLFLVYFYSRYAYNQTLTLNNISTAMELVGVKSNSCKDRKGLDWFSSDQLRVQTPTKNFIQLWNSKDPFIFFPLKQQLS